MTTQLSLPMKAQPAQQHPARTDSPRQLREQNDALDEREAMDVPFDAEDFEEPAEGAGESFVDDRPLPSRDELLSSARLLADAISRELDKPVRLYVTDNRSTMVSFRRERERLVLRVHHMFLAAPEDVVRSLADYAGRGTRAAGNVIDRFVRDNSNVIRAEPEDRPRKLVARGLCHDLKEMYERLNARFFNGEIRARIGWGRGTSGRRRRSIRMGVYDHLTKTIRVHPALDRPEVPAFFVEYIVFHEMLHQAVPGDDKGDRRQHHGPEFRRRERAYPEYAKAIAWEKENLHLLLGRQTPIRVRPVD